ncbi:Predicted kinase [Tistlia consotensis]|uniref:Predicted kinase n=1 Tax=Tistlia consotensis USBA 355 TaxID=560819 RepID=A0A1Y6CU12_9PROT|nr:AAA family ATPase [Tistlia consotensis]SMF77109.1 Predicted kinase [Tistlia consotensis USBA 355]SNS14179.1 Predicted kinase [Tistlia consotensis]
MLVILGGLPGSGKSTVARLAAARLGAVLLRIDSIEQAIRESWLRPADVADAGYRAAGAAAADNLRLGRTVIADSVNPVELSRAGWRAVAEGCSAPFLEVEVVCSDPAEHRRRVESRRPDIAGLALPDWDKVTARDYEPWPNVGLRLDTAVLSAEAAAARLVAAVGDAAPPRHPREGGDP